MPSPISAHLLKDQLQGEAMSFMDTLRQIIGKGRTDDLELRSEKVEAKSSTVIGDAKTATDAWWRDVRHADSVIQPKNRRR